MDKKKLQDEIRYIKDLLDSKENELGKIEKEEDNTNFYKCLHCEDCTKCCNSPYYGQEDDEAITVSVEIDCENDELCEFIAEYVSDEINDLVDEAVELFHKNEVDFDEDDECKSELKFELIGDKENNIAGVVMVGFCPECEEEHVLQIFSNGDKGVENMAKDMGFRD